jgi:hypothetical protein
MGMAFPTNTETSTTLASYIPAIWGQKINEFFRAKLVCAEFFINRSDEVAQGGNTLYTPTTTEMSANAKANATQVTLNNPTDAKVTLTINQWYECSFAIEDAEAAQTKRSYEIMKTYAQGVGYEIAKTLDAAMTALFSTFSTSVGSSTVNLADSDVRAAIAQLEATNVDSQEAAFIMHPNVFWKQLQAIDKFSLAINAPGQNPVLKEPAAYLYGRKVWTTTQVVNVSGTTGRYNAFAHPSSIHFATSPLGDGGSQGAMVGSNGIRVQSNYFPTYLSTITTADILYGAVMNRSNAGVAVITPA